MDLIVKRVRDQPEPTRPELYSCRKEMNFTDRLLLILDVQKTQRIFFIRLSSNAFFILK